MLAVSTCTILHIVLSNGGISRRNPFTRHYLRESIMDDELTAKDVKKMFEAIDRANDDQAERAIQRMLEREANIHEEEDYSEYEDYHSQK